MLAGWLVNTARLVAKTAARAESRRRKREQRVADMTARAEGQTDAELHALLQVDEHLDDALARLSDADRTAVTLRYLQGLLMREVAEQMGTSEAAANKRVTRAVEKLRDIFRRKGLMIAPALMTSALLRQAEVVVPQQLTAATVTASVLHTANAGSAAAQLAHAAMSGTTMKFAFIAAAAVLLLAAVVGASVVAYVRLTNHAGRQFAVAAPAPANMQTNAPPTSAALPPRIRVGVYISLNTAEVKQANGKRNWQQMFRIVEELRDPHPDVAPIVEPTGADDAELKQRLAETFPGKTPIPFAKGNDPWPVDVIVAATVCWPTDDAIDAIEQAVRGGRGLVVRQCLGGDDNGYLRPVVRRLRLLDDAAPDALLATAPALADVTATHPLLGDLSGRTTDAIRIRTYGGYGLIAAGATPLLVLRDTSGVVYNSGRKPVTPIPGYSVCPLAVGQLGQGRIVSCSFTANNMPPELDQATGGRFMPRAIRWAAGQPVE